MRPDLIFDLGVFDGKDSRYYLDKGFRVVGVEASPVQAAMLRELFALDILNGRYTLAERAIWNVPDETIPFFLHGEQSSALKCFAASYGPVEKTEAKTTTIAELFKSHGVPHYLKCDIEGSDHIVLEHLRAEKTLPTFISVEAHEQEIVDRLAALGYDRFQIVNQQFHHLTKARAEVSLGMTGPFGDDLQARFWFTRDKTLAQLARRRRILSPMVGKFGKWLYKRYGKLTKRHWLIADGWLDIHACRSEALK